MATKNKVIDFGNVQMSLEDFAIQGNALLGIKETGKSSTAIYTAERLLDNGIPFVAFDQIGIWPNIKIPGKGKGYQVVVAGGRNPDLPLSVAAAPEIMRAAMRKNIPLVIDLYDRSLSQTDRRKIIQICTEILLYENADYGPRMIYYEEAARVVPQAIRPEGAQLFSTIEALCEMGGNSLLGYTLIGLRPQAINKSVLELCDCLILFRQKGVRSLQALDKWLSTVDVKNSDIAKEIPKLGAGECYIWPREESEPVRTRVPQKNSFHPDRRNPTLKIKAAKNTVDVSGFVSTLSGSLEKYIKEAEQNDPKFQKARILDLEKRLAAAENAKARVMPAAPAAAPKIKIVEKPVMNKTQEKLLRELVTMYKKTLETVPTQIEELKHSLLEFPLELQESMAFLNDVIKSVDQAGQHSEAAAIPQKTLIDIAPPTEVLRPGGHLLFESHGAVEPIQESSLQPNELIILQYASQFEDGITRTAATVYSGYHKDTRNKAIRNLISNGYMIETASAMVKATAQGVQYLRMIGSRPQPLGVELRARWLRDLDQGGSTVLGLLFENPAGLSRLQISESTNYHKDTRNKIIRALLKYFLVEDNGSTISVSEYLH